MTSLLRRSLLAAPLGLIVDPAHAANQGWLVSGSNTGRAGYVGVFSRLMLPSDIPGLVAWWDINTNVVLSGSNVTSWTDRVGGIVASQATGTAQPTFSATGFIDRPGIVSASGKQLATAASSFALSGPMTIFASVYPTSSSDGRWFECNGTTRPVIHASTTASSVVSDTAWTINGAAPGANGAVHGGIFNGASSASSLNGTIVTGGSASTPTVTQVYLSGDSGKFQPFIGAYRHVVIYSGALSTTDRQNLEGILAWDAGLQGLLPAGHPRKSAAPNYP